MMTQDEIMAFANELLGIASLVNPGLGAAGKVAEDLMIATKLFSFGTAFSDRLSQVREETDATAAQVGANVSADYVANRNKMLASFAAHPGK